MKISQGPVQARQNSFAFDTTPQFRPAASAKNREIIVYENKLLLRQCKSDTLRQTLGSSEQWL
jgi:hypothetical protein